MSDQSVKQRVFAAAAELLVSTGKKPKVNDVRKLAKCAMQDATDYLAEWHDEQLGKSSAPVIIPEKVQQAFAECWSIASKLASDQVEALRNEYEANRAVLVENLTSVADELDDTINQRDQKQSDLDALNISLSTAHATIQEKDAELANANKRIQELDLKLQEKTAQYTQCQALLNSKAEDLSASQQQNARLEERCSALAKNYDALNAEHKSLKQLAAETQTALSASQQACATQTGRINELVTHLTEAQQELSDLQKQTGSATGKIEFLQNQVSTYEQLQKAKDNISAAAAKGLSDALAGVEIGANPYVASKQPEEHLEWFTGYLRGLHNKLNITNT